MPGTVPSMPSDVAVVRVQSSFWGKGFSFFPRHQATTTCRIPGPMVWIRGTCRTRVSVYPGAESALVTFTEFWPARKFRTHGPPTGTLHHSWRFLVRTRGSTGLRAGRVLRRGGEGAFPPQSAQ
jgi:hypothetical protein